MMKNSYIDSREKSDLEDMGMILILQLLKTIYDQYSPN